MPELLPDAKTLLYKYKSGTCSLSERRLVECWYEELGLDVRIPESLVIQEDLDEVWLRLEVECRSPRPKIFARRYVQAAAVLILGVLLFAGINYYGKHDRQILRSQAQIISPGGDYATLSTSDGLKIPLDSISDSLTENQANIGIRQTEHGHIVYTAANHVTAISSVPVHMISTPKGGQFSVTLSDGTRAWLNAGSTLTYPPYFSGHQRRVSITGEVYFEVAADKRKPFRVAAPGLEIKVLGTHFNVSAYPDDGKISTTLFEGAVALKTAKKETQIIPGQVAVWKPDGAEIHTFSADLESVLAWKNGYFIFNEEHIQPIMDKLSRWYNVEVSYRGDLRGLNFSARIPRKSTISEVLSILEATGTIHFKIEERRIIVSQH